MNIYENYIIGLTELYHLALSPTKSGFPWTADTWWVITGILLIVTIWVNLQDTTSELVDLFGLMLMIVTFISGSFAYAMS